MKYNKKAFLAVALGLALPATVLAQGGGSGSGAGTGQSETTNPQPDGRTNPQPDGTIGGETDAARPGETGSGSMGQPGTSGSTSERLDRDSETGATTTTDDTSGVDSGNVYGDEKPEGRKRWWQFWRGGEKSGDDIQPEGGSPQRR